MANVQRRVEIKASPEETMATLRDASRLKDIGDSHRITSRSWHGCVCHVLHAKDVAQKRLDG